MELEFTGALNILSLWRQGGFVAPQRPFAVYNGQLFLVVSDNNPSILLMDHQGNLATAASTSCGLTNLGTTYSCSNIRPVPIDYTKRIHPQNPIWLRINYALHQILPIMVAGFDWGF